MTDQPKESEIKTETTPMGPPPESDEKIIATIGYLAFLFVVPLIVKPKSKFCQHHAKQSMILFFVTIIVLVFLAVTPLFGSVFTLALFALYILSLYRAFSGDYWKIPVIGTFSDKINLEGLYGKAGISASSLTALKEKAAEAAKQMTKTVDKMSEQEPEKK